MVGEARAAEVGLAQILRLDHHPHRAVDDRDARGQKIKERVEPRAA